MANQDAAHPTVALTSFSNGSICFRHEEPGRPATTETSGNITVRNAEIPPKPSFFDVSFNIGAHLNLAGAETHSTLLLNIPVPRATSDIPYREVEDEAARHLPQVLRALADLIATDLERVAKELADRRAKQDRSVP